MRQQLLRTLRRSQRPASQANAVRNLSSSARRAAEVELTIDGKKVSIEGMHTPETLWKPCADTDTLMQPAPLSFRPAKRPALSFPATATTRNS
jgi:hypothetical protein